MNRLTKLKILLFALSIIAFSQTYAKVRISPSNTKTGTGIAIDNYLYSFVDFLTSVSSTNANGTWTPPTSLPSIINSYDFLSKTARVKLSIIEFKNDVPNYCLPSKFTFTITIQCQIYNSMGVFGASQNKTLTVNYDRAAGNKYKSMDIIQFDDALLIGCKIIAISNTALVGYVKLESEIEVDCIKKIPFDQFDNINYPDPYHTNLYVNSVISKINTTSSNPYSLGANGIELDFNIITIGSNNHPDFAEWTDSVEIQWLYIDDDQYIDLYTGGNLKGRVDFKSASSVILPYNPAQSNLNFYKISNIFDKGLIFVRVRAIGKLVETHNNLTTIRRIENYWSGKNGQVVGDLFDLDGAIANFNSIQVDKFLPTKNWQYNCTYAEEGKKKELISYFDGGYKNRQTITESNSNGEKYSIVKETVYDFQGRPAIEVLPIPIPSCNLIFVPNLNQNLAGDHYSAKDFDFDQTACNTTTASMSNSSGAAKYYSENNNWLVNNDLSNIHQYIPTSGTTAYYPFIQTEYTPDNTGRIVKSTQPGETFKLGSNKETRYFYGKPSQQEIDRLFGEEIGFSEHYVKEMIKDPNGQISINFKNASGKVIATALAGNSATKLTPLSTSTTSFDIEDNLLKNNQISIENGFELSGQILVEKTEDYQFKYSLSPEKYESKCDEEIKYCLDCAYDLEISLTDECGNEKFANGTIKKIIGPSGAETNFNATCSTSVYDYSTNSELNNTDGYISVSLEPGVYTIKRTIKINDYALAQYKEKIFETAACKTLANFEAEELLKINPYGCDICVQYDAFLANSSATKEAYADAKLLNYAELNYTGSDPIKIAEMNAKKADKILLFKNEFTTMMAEAEKFCKGGSPCDAYKVVLMADVTPGGLYAAISSGSNTNYSKSVLNPVGGTTANDLGYSYKDLKFFNETKSGIFGMMGTNKYEKSLAELTPTEFLKVWKDKYAEELIVLHPEYYQYANCSTYKESRKTDQLIANTVTYAEAINKGYLTSPSIGNNTSFKDNFHLYQSPNPVVVSSADLAFLTDGLNSKAIETLSGIPFTTTNFSRDLSIRELAAYIVLCKDVPPPNPANPNYRLDCITNKLLNLSTCDPKIQNLFWNMYKGLYIAVKSRLYEKLNKETRTTTTTPNYYEYVFSTNSISTNLNYVERYSKLIPANERFKQEKTNRNSDGTLNSAFVTEGCQNRCESYADVWIAKLSNCSFGQDPNQIAILKAALVNVCKEGCDEKSPLGASSVRPNSLSTDRTFNDVLVRLGYYQAKDCDGNLLNFPPAYGMPYRSFEIGTDNKCGTPFKSVNFRSSCPDVTGCTSGNNDLATAIKTIDKLTPNPCDENKICRTCQDLIGVYSAFYKVNTIAETNSNFESAFVTYMNDKLSLNTTFTEFINTMKACLGYPSTIANNITSTSQILKEFRYTFLIYNIDASSNIIALNENFPHPILNVARNDKNNIFELKFKSEYIPTSSFQNYYSNTLNNNNVVFASLDNDFVLNTKSQNMLFAPPPPPAQTQVEVNPCICTTLQRHYDDYNAIVLPLIKPATFDDYLLSININSPNALKVLELCKKAFESIALSGTFFTSSSNFTEEQTEELWLWTEGFSASCVICNNCPVPGEPLPLRPPPINPCFLFKQALDSMNLVNSMQPLDYFDDDFSGNTNFAKLLSLYNTIIGKYNYDNSFIVLTQINPVNVMEWYKSLLCRCGISNKFCKSNFDDIDDEITPCPPVGSPNYTKCSKCYTTDKKLLYLMQTLNKVVKETNGSISICNNNINRRTNSLNRKEMFMNPLLQDEYCDNDAFYPSANSTTLRNSLKWNGIRSRGSRYKIFQGIEHFSINIKDDAVHIDNIALSYDFNENRKLSLSYLKSITRIKPVYINSCGNTQHFIAEGIMVITDVAGCFSKEVTVTFSGTYKAKVTREIDCGVKDIRICKTIIPPPSPCEQFKSKVASNNARIRYDNYLIQLLKDEEQNYINKCLSAIPIKEVFVVKFPSNQYHFTLYYYDMVGNLIKTVPPNGVVALNQTQINAISSKRDGTNTSTTTLPSHQLVTSYTYNTLNQLVQQQTPDAGQSKFWYDKVGRLVLSQNAKQVVSSTSSNHKHSYTIFDKIGRIEEVGEIILNSSVNSTLHDPITGPFAAEDNTFFEEKIINETQRFQITKTFYDNNSDIEYTLNNLRTRVAKVAYYPNYYILNGATIKPEHAVMYNYDVQGNVTQIIRYIKGLEVLNQHLKKVDYQFDVVSGKVESVTYQNGKVDQYIHHYKYDAENRLIKSFSSPRKELIDYTGNYGSIGLDADYSYYFHGPLARTVLGENKVQGIDYAYTLQGWLKGVNSISLKTETDMGKDGHVPVSSFSNNATNSNTKIAKDEFGFALNYYDGDYKQIQDKIPSTTTNYPVTWQFTGAPETSGTPSTLYSNQKSLYNGNISQMVTAIGKLMTNNVPLASTYEYDQLNRIINAKYLNNFDATNNKWSATGNLLSDWENSFTYDANGNILTQLRNGAGTTVAMDNLKYNYKTNTNQLTYVEDLVINSNNYSDDIDDQKVSVIANNRDNYEYDAIGNLIYDKAEEIKSIEWNLYGKIKKIERISGSAKPDLEFEYTPDGHRALKLVIPKNPSLPKIYTYYMRDAQGNIMATYEREFIKTIDYEALDYPNVYAKLSINVGNNGFASFIAQVHQNNSNVKSALASNLTNANTGTSAKRDQFLNNNDLPALLKDNNNLNSTKTIIASYNNWDFLNAIISSYGVSNVSTLEQSMNLRYVASSAFPNLQKTIVDNNVTLDLLFTNLNAINMMAYNNILNNLSITPSNLNDDIIALNTYLSSNGSTDILTNLNNEIQFENLNQGTQAHDLVFDLLNNNSSFRDALFNSIAEFKELFFVSGSGSLNYTGNQLNLPTIINDLNNYNSSLLQTTTRNNFSGGENSMVDWYKTHQPYPFLYFATLADITAVTSYQTNNTGLYKPSGSTLPGNGISLYFNEIKTYFGQGLVDQLVGVLITNNNQNLYIDKLLVNEWHIYGSSRLGIYKANVLVASKEVHINTTSANGQTTTSSDYSTLLTDDPILTFDTYSQTRGAKNYELSNHLGNVLVVITDKKTWCTNKEVYSSDFKTGTNGFDGGWSKYTQGGPNWSGIDQYNGSIVTNDNGRLKTTATVGYGGNRNVVNTEANKSYTFTFDLDIGNTTGLYVNARATNGSSIYTGTNLAQIYVTASGTYTLTFTATATATATTQLLFEKDNYGTSYFYIDNARVEETDVISPGYYMADVVTANDYSPFGAPMATRTYTAPNSSYRFHFNGQEKDDEVSGGGNTMTATFWEYDARLGRRWNLDPKPDISISSYSCFRNNPILFNDVDGDTVKFGGFIDRVRATIGKIFSKDFREKFKKWDASNENFTLRKDNHSNQDLEHATPDFELSPANKNEHTVRYNSGIGFNDVSSTTLRNIFAGIRIPLSIVKFSIALPVGLLANVTGFGMHWGAGNKIYGGSKGSNGVLLFGWGLGDYNQYNWHFGTQNGHPIYPNDGLIGVRFGLGIFGAKYHPNFIDIGGSNIYNVHLHLNMVFPTKRRHRKLNNESIIDFHQRK